jgi:putative FmdB family regulatory protein
MLDQSSMPSYDFTCQDCDTTYEVRLSMSAYSDGEGRKCQACGSKRVERAFTAVNVITGSGSRGESSPSLGAGCGSGGFT